MVTVQEVFDMAIDLMDEQDENSGSTDTVDTKEYMLRTISILNAGIAALYPYSSTFDKNQDGRPAAVPLIADSRKTPDFTQVIPLDDALCRGLLPFYLASLLKTVEDTEFSVRMMTEYNNALIAIRDKIPAEFEDIVPAYGLF